MDAARSECYVTLSYRYSPTASCDPAAAVGVRPAGQHRPRPQPLLAPPGAGDGRAHLRLRWCG